MKYTKNHHLPQWDDSDRIMRTDFNQMCADIEAGLDGAKQLAQDARQAAQSAQSTAESSGASATLQAEELSERLAYNHYCLVQAQASTPVQIGFFSQNTAAMTSTPSGMGRRDGYLYMVHSDEPPTQEAFYNSITQITPLNIIKNNPSASTPLVLEFFAPAPGQIIRTYSSGSYNALEGGSSDGLPCRWEMLNLDTGKVEHTFNQTIRYIVIDETSGRLERESGHVFPFHGGYRYQLRVTPLFFNVNANFATDLSFTMATFRGGAAETYPGGTVSYTMQDVETSRGGMAILRCKYGGPNATFTLRWNGKALAPRTIRNISYKSLGTVQEIIFRKDETLPAKNTLSLSFQCGKYGEFFFYDWGAILF